MGDEQQAVTSEASVSAGGPTSGARPGRWIAVLAGVLVLLSWLPVPGVDGESLEMAMGGGVFGVPRLAGSPVPLLGAGVLTLVPLHLVLMLAGLADRPKARVGAAVLCLAAVALEAVALAVWLESLNATWYDVVAEPGWFFRLTVLVTRVAGASVVLWAVNRVDRTEGAWGALALSVLYAMGSATAGATEVGGSVGGGAISPWMGLAVLVTPLCVLAVGLALVVRPVRWPVPLVGKVTLRSGWDVAGAITLASVPVVMLGSALSTLSTSPPGGLVPLGAGFQLLFTLVVVVLVFRGERGSQRPIGLVVLSACGFLGAAVLAGVGFGATPGAWARLTSPGPLAGDASFVVVLGAEDTFSAGDGEAMAERLASLGAEARVEAESASEITLSVTGRGPEEAVDALTPHALSFRFAHRFASDPYAGVSGVRATLSQEPGSHAWEGDCAAVRELLAGSPPGACRLRMQTAEESCTLYCVDLEPTVTQDDIAEASVSLDSYSNSPVVTLRLADAAALRFEEATAAHVHDLLTIELDDEVVSAPMVQSAIPGGQVRITLGSYRSLQEQTQEAEQLAASLNAPHMPWGHFTLLEVR